MGNLKLNQFDVVGIFDINDNIDIEELVTATKNGYLSRTMQYYKNRTVDQYSRIRENLKERLTTVGDPKKQFIIIEYMFNCSVNAMYAEAINCIKTGEQLNYLQCKKCANEDCLNLVKLLQHEDIVESIEELPKSNLNGCGRIIEMDNKCLLYLFTKLQPVKEDSLIITPGLGSICIGPFMNAVYGVDYEIADFSKYKNSQESLNMEESITNKNALNNENLYVIDDNIGTGNTMKEISHWMNQNNKNCKYAAIQYNWTDFRDKVIGVNKEDRFDTSQIDIITPIHYPGHKLLEHAIEQHLTVSGDEYIKYLDSKHYRRNNESDLQHLFSKGVNAAKEAGVFFDRDLNNENTDSTRKLNEESILFSERLNICLENINISDAKLKH